MYLEAMVIFSNVRGYEYIILFVCATGRSLLNAYMLAQLLRLTVRKRRAIAGIILWCVGCGALITLMVNQYWWSQLAIWAGWAWFGWHWSRQPFRRVALATVETWTCDMLATLVASWISSYTFVDMTLSELALPPDYLPTCLLLLALQALFTIGVVSAGHRGDTMRRKADLVFGAWLILQGFAAYSYLYYAGTVRDLGLGYDIAAIVLSASYLLLTGLYMRHARHLARQQAESEALQSEMREQQKRFDALSSELDRIRSVRHDLNNHMTVLASLAQSGKRHEALEYLDNLEKTLASAQVRPEGDLAPYTALVATQAAILRENGIDLRCQALSTEEPDAAQTLDPLIVWAGRFALLALSDRQDARMEISFCDGRRSIECEMHPFTRQDLRKCLRTDANADIHIPVRARFLSPEGNGVRFRVTLAMDEEGARDPSHIRP